MMRFATLKGPLTIVLLGAVLAMAGCSMFGHTRSGEVTTASMKGHFDVVIKAYKEGQFLVDGAVLSALDTGSHFAYLRDQGKLPKSVLLEPSDDSGIHKQHLQYLARMAIDYGFKAYYDDRGTLVQINPEDTKARALQDHVDRKPVQDAQPSGGGMMGGGVGGGGVGGPGGY